MKRPGVVALGLLAVVTAAGLVLFGFEVGEEAQRAHDVKTCPFLLDRAAPRAGAATWREAWIAQTSPTSCGIEATEGKWLLTVGQAPGVTCGVEPVTTIPRAKVCR